MLVLLLVDKLRLQLGFVYYLKTKPVIEGTLQVLIGPNKEHVSGRGVAVRSSLDIRQF